MPKPHQSDKVSIIGCGKVGMTAAYALLLKGIPNELVLVSRCVDDIVGEELDLEHGMAFMDFSTIHSTQDYADISGSDVVIITAGASQKPGETRLDLLSKNLSILESILPKVLQHAPNAIILLVSNPVDILTYHAYKIAGLPKGRILGSGTTLDSARFRFHLSEFLHISPSSIHAYILGEHGDHSFPALSGAMVGGQPLSTFPEYSAERAQAAYEKARTAAYKIIASKGSTYYGIGTVIAHMVETILRDSRSVLPVSIPLHGYYDLHGMAVSVPCVIGRQGVERSLEIKLSWEEKQKLERAVQVLKESYQASSR